MAAAAAAERKSSSRSKVWHSFDYGALCEMKLVRNITLTPEAEEFIKQRYIEPDVASYSELQFMPRFIWVIAYKDADGKIMEGETVGYKLSRSPVSFLADSVIASFDGGRKFFAVEFNADGEKYDADAHYTIEHFDDINYIIKLPSEANERNA
ncbi:MULTISPECIES: hypothetical protein [Mesorhizobium]|uniref:Uncharacterized protein n=1 Tax=Mesorhizobium shonense TaxID=1209948 RepID=A0ABV2HS14_9HYPH|nr:MULTISPECIES: hypothetical protein [unclassified Mesorhizobium]AZO30146.1 hypothetical protein EJ071_24000 [Mesorhizobium sp. M1B.F.Ca.ET.045.04.1.1]RWA69973.1 MAG: hypothetical protein EOQ29_14670 [Mesorhizobium sp.]RWA79889.1 MAG: hypothetical protein EOQ30_23680 [Mesorhizobium sp.]TIS47596.1 MAG: hypothetical protein E5W96_20935 [Mesorhizobium sp.]TIS48351.1 MAG: hypothetical protein E5W96_18590 [Mesorhizobium sp.]